MVIDLAAGKGRGKAEMGKGKGKARIGLALHVGPMSLPRRAVASNVGLERMAQEGMEKDRKAEVEAAKCAATSSGEIVIAVTVAAFLMRLKMAKAEMERGRGKVEMERVEMLKCVATSGGVIVIVVTVAAFRMMPARIAGRRGTRGDAGKATKVEGKAEEPNCVAISSEAIATGETVAAFRMAMTVVVRWKKAMERVSLQMAKGQEIGNALAVG